MTKRAVCVGINDYPGTHNDLNGCVNDAHDWAELLRKDFEFGDNVSLLIDSEATQKNIQSSLADLVTGAGSGDVIVFTYSGHGTWEYDRGERDESDNRDEAICAYDGNIIDDTIRDIIRQMNNEVHLTFISDSCHSGTVTRAMLERVYEEDQRLAETAPKPRYMPPVDDTDALRTDLIPIRRRFNYPESDMSEVLITGCNATEYSYDAYLGGRYNGAMTALAIRLMRSNPKQTYEAFHKELRVLLPSTRYPQSPQLEGTKADKKRALFT